MKFQERLRSQIFCKIAFTLYQSQRGKLNSRKYFFPFKDLANLWKNLLINT